MAAKKAKRGSKPASASGSKKDFILSFPADTPAADIVAAGKAKGLAFSTAYVYVLRSKASGGTRAAKRAATTPRAARSGRGARSSSEAAFVELALELGLNRAADLLTKLRLRARELAG